MPVNKAENEAELLSRAIAGEPLALERLLVHYQSRLFAWTRTKLPVALRGMVAPEDVLQETYVEAFRTIRHFEPRGGPAAFYRWLLKVAQRRLIDMLRMHQAAKRGGAWEALHVPTGDGSGFALLEALRAYSHTPSRVAASREAAAAVQNALKELKPEYREALELRFLKGLSVPDTAARMGRSEWAVHKLCGRGLQNLRELLGDTTRYLSQV